MVQVRTSRGCRWVVGVSLVLASAGAHAEGGKWTPEQLLDHDPAWLTQLGLELPAKALWSEEDGGLLEAVVQVGGCSSGFVSPEGLLITNHHCVFGILQEHSTAENDLTQTGFLAEERSQELRGRATRASIPHRFVDVTSVIEAAAAGAADDLDRYRRIESKRKELIAECEAQEFRRCRVATYDDGVRYTLIEAREYPDVRLVYAPPRAVGEYGGEVDNWMWPRHTGDFALLRVYANDRNEPVEHTADNIPYRSSRFLPVAREGVTDGSFVMVVGYPGRTYRRFLADEMEERFSLFFPGRASLYVDWIAEMDRRSEADDEARVLLASRRKSLANREKNARGQIVGFERGDLIAKKRAREAEILAWAAVRKEGEEFVEAHGELEQLHQRRLETWDRDFLLDNIGSGSLPLAHAVTITRWALEAEKPDADRDPAYQERNRDRTQARLERDQGRLHVDTEIALLQDWVNRVSSLPRGQRVEPIDQRVGTVASPASAVEAWVEGSPLLDLDQRLTMLGENVDALRARKDPLIDLGLALNEQVLLPRRDRDDAIAGAVSRWRPIWRRAVEQYAQAPVDPDANGTLRVSLARVQGYSPRDGVWMTPQTRLAGVVEKHTGEEPFAAPSAVLEMAGEASRSRWADAALRDVPICFLATGDTTGGSSGSPVLNGRGELVGVNFDRVWENIANDFGYNPEIARNVTADVRYLLWMLETIEGPRARAILRELGLEGAGLDDAVASD